MQSVQPPPALGEVLAGLLLSLTVPLVGFVVGGMWLSRGGRCVAAGATASAFAIAALAFWLAFTY
jgi:positive regulator of sigma E activity